MENLTSTPSSMSFLDIIYRPVNLGLTTIPLWVILVLIIIVIIMLCKLGIFNNMFESIKKMTGGAENENKINTTIKLYNFNTSWCGHSVDFQPIWDKFSRETNIIANLEALDVKCDNEDGDEICNEYKVNAFPTIILEKYDEKGEPIRITYTGERTLEALNDFRNANV